MENKWLKYAPLQFYDVGEVRLNNLLSSIYVYVYMYNVYMDRETYRLDR